MLDQMRSLAGELLPVLLVSMTGDPESAARLEGALTAWGHAPVLAADTESALQVLGLDDADGRIIVVDGRGQAREAVACCRAIRDRTAPACVHYLLILANEDAALLPEAFTVGATCLMMSEYDEALLQARMVAITQRSRRQTQQQAHLNALTQAHQAMKQDLHELVAIQQQFLPDRSRHLPGVDFDWLYRPAFIVSGDHIGLMRLSPRELAFCLVDVMGHGIVAAMRALEMARALSLHPNDGMLQEPAAEPGGMPRLRSPAEVATCLNEAFKMTEASPIYCTLVYGVLDVSTGEGRFVQAGHASPLWLGREGEVEMLGEGGFPIGLIDDPGYEDIHFRLEPGDRLFLYSDGLTEAVNPAGQVYGEQRLSDFLRGLTGSPHRQLGLLGEDIAGWLGSGTLGQPQDDLSMLMISYQGTESPARHPELLGSATGWQPGAEDLKDVALREAVASASREPETIRTLMLNAPEMTLAAALPELSARGMVVDMRPLGDERLDLVELAQYQLVLLAWAGDLAPQRAVLARIRELRLSSPIYVMAVRFGHDPRSELDALQAGADDCVFLPMPTAEMRCRIHAGRQWIARDRILREALRQQQLLNEQVIADLQVIEGFQRSCLPRQGALHGEVEWGWLYLPALHVSADHLGVSLLDDDHIAFFALHSQRRGMLALVNNWATARLVTHHIRGNLLHDAAGLIRSPGAVMVDIHVRYSGRRMAPYLCSMTYGVLDIRSGQGRLAHVGACPPLLVRADGRLERIGATTEVLGSARLPLIMDHAFSLADGDRLFLSGSGLDDLAAGVGQGVLVDALRTSQDESLLRRALTDLEAGIDGWRRQDRQRGGEHDVTLLALQRGSTSGFIRKAPVGEGAGRGRLPVTVPRAGAGAHPGGKPRPGGRHDQPDSRACAGGGAARG